MQSLSQGLVDSKASKFHSLIESSDNEFAAARKLPSLLGRVSAAPRCAWPNLCGAAAGRLKRPSNAHGRSQRFAARVEDKAQGIEREMQFRGTVMRLKPPPVSLDKSPPGLWGVAPKLCPVTGPYCSQCAPTEGAPNAAPWDPCDRSASAEEPLPKQADPAVVLEWRTESHHKVQLIAEGKNAEGGARVSSPVSIEGSLLPARPMAGCDAPSLSTSRVGGGFSRHNLWQCSRFITLTGCTHMLPVPCRSRPRS